MDKERYELENREGKIKEIMEKMKFDPENPLLNINYRLTQEYEVPNWIHVETLDHKDGEMKEYGKGMRSKQRINYRDDIDEFDDEENSEINRKRRRAKNVDIQTPKKRRIDDESEEDRSSYINLDDEDYNEVSRSTSFKKMKFSNTKMRINLNSNSNLKIGIIKNVMLNIF